MNVNITDLAREKLLEEMGKNKLEKPALRIYFAGYGWGGPRMGLALDELVNNNEDDKTIEIGSITVVMDTKIQSYVDMGYNLKVDYQDYDYGSGFIVTGGSTC